MQRLLNKTVGTIDNQIKKVINYSLQTIQPTTILATFIEHQALNQEEYDYKTYLIFMLATTLQIRNALQIYHQWNTSKIIGNLLDTVTISAVNTPLVGTLVEKRITKEISGLLKPLKESSDHKKSLLNYKPIVELPEKAMSDDEILQQFNSIEMFHKKGRNSGAIYGGYDNEKRKNLFGQIYSLTSYTNPLHPDIWPLIREIEADVFSICNNLFGASEAINNVIEPCGTTTSIQIINAYAQFARDVLGINHPEMIAPDTIHFAFNDKAAKLLNIKLILVPVDPKTGKSDVDAMENCINENTILLLGSANCFKYGVVDRIEKIAALALKHKIFCHVDACLGGFLLAFVREKFNLPKYDLSIPGVDSIAADIHKYGYGPKGLSFGAIKDKQLFSPTPTYTNLKRDMYVSTDYTNGSRSGAMGGLAFATLLSIGRENYTKMAEEIVQNARTLAQALKKIDGIIIPFETELSIVFIRTKPGLDHHLVVEKFEEADKENGKLGWNVNDFIDGFHFCVTAEFKKENIELFVRDLENAVNYVAANPNLKSKGIAKAYKYVKTGLIPPIIQTYVGDAFERIYKSLYGKQVSRLFSAISKSEHQNKMEMIEENSFVKKNK